MIPLPLVLINLGTPDSPTSDAVRAFLAEFLGDPAVVDWPRWLWLPLLRWIILPRRTTKTAALYQKIWTVEGSPLAAGTRRIAAALTRTSRRWIEPIVANRYGTPSVGEALDRAAALAPTGPIPVIDLFPQRTSSTTGTIAQELRRQAAARGLAERLQPLRIAPDEPFYIEAQAARCRDAFAAAGREPEHLLLSFHGIPSRCDRREGHRYSADCTTTAKALLATLGWPEERSTLVYQSRFGPERWLVPATLERLAQLPSRGVRRLAVVTPGFVTEGLETIEEVDSRGRKIFVEAGGDQFIRVLAVGDHPRFIAGLSEKISG